MFIRVLDISSKRVMFEQPLLITQEVSMDSLKRMDDAGERVIAAVRTAQDWAA